MKKNTCKDCHGVIAGCAMTYSICEECGKEILNASTHTANLCEECTEEKEVCKYCKQEIK
jgi:hypothetical protein